MTSIKKVCHYSEIFRQKFYGESTVRHDATDSSRGNNYYVWFLFSEEIKDGISVEKVEIFATFSNPFGVFSYIYGSR
jgi:hypothetical protein